ncbi:Complex 1 protein (LYR family)/Complex1 LYR-like [Novymonas esmeraldas]|uniref:Complex 1 protein (LYR family)/Complex1 LYR-like n=1 Tax=Novymonas esmeraldas TaxID=1808958 RepID=A0AAW0EW37_9TRYP
MRGCLRRTCLVRHQRRDKGGNTHNFPFDTLTRVYRDAVYVPQERHRGNPMYPERDGAAAAAPTASPHVSDVTNHVGGIGVMSPVATRLSDWLAREQQEQQEQQQEQQQQQTPVSAAAAEGGSSGAGGCASSSSGGGRASAIARPRRVTAAAASPSAHDQPTDEAVRQRLRAHLFTEGSTRRGGAGRAGTDLSNTHTAVPRHSGVQVEILSVYRRMLRQVARLQDAETRRGLAAHIRAEYEKQRDVPRKNILRIEWQLNYARRKLEDLEAMGTDTKFTVMR